MHNIYIVKQNASRSTTNSFCSLNANDNTEHKCGGLLSKFLLPVGARSVTAALAKSNCYRTSPRNILHVQLAKREILTRGVLCVMVNAVDLIIKHYTAGYDTRDRSMHTIKLITIRLL